MDGMYVSVVVARVVYPAFFFLGGGILSTILFHELYCRYSLGVPSYLRTIDSTSPPRWGIPAGHHMVDRKILDNEKVS